MKVSTMEMVDTTLPAYVPMRSIAHVLYMYLISLGNLPLSTVIAQLDKVKASRVNTLSSQIPD